MEWVATGRIFDAAEALRGGLVSRVVPDDELLPAARALAREIVENTSGAGGRRGPAAAVVDARRAVAVGRPPAESRGAGRARLGPGRRGGRRLVPGEAPAAVRRRARARRRRRACRAGRCRPTTSSRRAERGRVPVFAVTFGTGPGWDRSLPRREQPGWRSTPRSWTPSWPPASCCSAARSATAPACCSPSRRRGAPSATAIGRNAADSSSAFADSRATWSSTTETAPATGSHQPPSRPGRAGEQDDERDQAEHDRQHDRHQAASRLIAVRASAPPGARARATVTRFSAAARRRTQDAEDGAPDADADQPPHGRGPRSHSTASAGSSSTQPSVSTSAAAAHRAGVRALRWPAGWRRTPPNPRATGSTTPGAGRARRSRQRRRRLGGSRQLLRSGPRSAAGR